MWQARVLYVVGAAAGTAMLALYLTAFEDAYIDDTFIQLQYARVLASDHSWGFLAGRPANTATSPLNVIATALFSLPFRSMVRAVTWLTAIELLVLLLALMALFGQLFERRYFGALAFAGFAANPLLLSTIGMDSILYTVLLVGSIVVFLRGQPWRLGILLGLLTLTRPEGVLLSAICLAMYSGQRSDRWRIGVAFVATLLPWHVFSWIYLGSAIPDTLLIKRKQYFWPASYVAGPGMYWSRYPVETALAAFLLPVAMMAVWWCRPRVCTQKTRTVAAIIGTYAVAHYLAYGFLRVPPYHWYYIHQVVSILVLGWIGIAVLVRVLSARPYVATTCTAVAALVPVLGLAYLAHRDGVPFKEPPIHTNWATQRHYRNIASSLATQVEPAAVLDVTGEIGTVAFYSRRRLRNEFSDMNIPTEWIHGSRLYERPYIGWLFRANFYWRRMLPPLEPSYHLEGEPATGVTPQGADVVKSWPTSTRWAPNGRLYLRRTVSNTPEGSPTGFSR